MIIADKLKDTDRAGYLLYMWQVEDVIRACGLDSDRIEREYIERFNLTPQQRSDMRRWYADLCEMMRSEGVAREGHLQICKNILSELSELHTRLLASPNFPYYKQMYYRILPYIVELRSKGAGRSEESELQTCFEALYGVTLLRMKGKEISPGTDRATKEIGTLLSQLSDYYLKDREEPLDFGIAE